MSYQQINNVDSQEAEIYAAGFLEFKAEEIRRRSIPWEMVQISKASKLASVKVISEYDGTPNKSKPAFLVDNSVELINSILTLLSDLKSEDILQYILTMMDDAILRDSGVPSLIHKASDMDSNSLYSLFIYLSKKEDSYIRNKAIKVLSSIAEKGPEMDSNLNSDLLSWLNSEVNSADKDTIQSVLLCLMSLLKVDKYRTNFYDIKNSVDSLSNLANSTSRFQIQYQVVFCYWLLTYNPDIAANITSRFHILKVLADIMGKANKEKVIRVCVLTIKNLLIKPKSGVDNARLMVTNKLLQQLRTLKDKSWKDEDLVADMDEVTEILEDMVQDMSTWDEYCTELRSGDLAWSSVHKSEGFWRECCIKLNENGHEMLKILIKSLDNMNPTVVSVAIHDIGEYAKHYRHGRRNIENLGGKSKIFTLMANENSDVRYEALSAIQKLLVNNASYLQNSKKVAA